MVLWSVFVIGWIFGGILQFRSSDQAIELGLTITDSMVERLRSKSRADLGLKSFLSRFMDIYPGWQNACKLAKAPPQCKRRLANGLEAGAGLDGGYGAVQGSFWTFTALRPLFPSRTSNSTAWPSLRVRYPGCAI